MSTAQAIEQLSLVSKSIRSEATSLQEALSVFEKLFDSIALLGESLAALKQKSTDFKVGTMAIRESINQLETLSSEVVKQVFIASSSEKEMATNFHRINTDAGLVADEADAVNRTSDSLAQFALELKKNIKVS